MPRVIVATESGETKYEISIAADDLRTPIARANFFVDLNAALKLADEPGQKESTQLENFMREQHYNRTLRLHTVLGEHLWSRRITVADQVVVHHAITELQQIANDLYLLREELKSE